MAFRIVIFGKQGCEKCKVLQGRVDDLLATGEWTDFEKVYVDVETEDGLVDFCRAECVNPARIPALLVMRPLGNGRFEPVPSADPRREDPVTKRSRLYSWIGLQTDYSDEGRGVISPKMIAAVLEDARHAAAP